MVQKKEDGNDDRMNELQALEQNLQGMLLQKQNLQSQLMEIESALSELEKTDEAYKIVGSVMVASKKDELKKELEGRQETINLRMKSIEKQEEKIRDKASKTQSEILKTMDKR